MSRGRSRTTDLPMPSGTKREFWSLPTTWITGAPFSIGICASIGARGLTRRSAAAAKLTSAVPAMAISAAADAVRINVLFAIMFVLFTVGWWPYFKCRSRVSGFTSAPG